MKVRLPREVWDTSTGDAIHVPAGIYEIESMKPYRGGIVLKGGQMPPVVGLLASPSEFIRLNDDGTQRMIKVRPDPGPTRQHFEWMYVANVDELQDAAFSAPPRRWQVETVDLTPEEVDALPEFGGW